MNEAGVIIITQGNKVLAVERKNNKGKYGFPGGKREVGESPKKGAARELEEEAGLIVDPDSLAEIFARNDSATPSFYVRCHYTPDWTGTPRGSDEGEVEWLTLEEICDTRSAFPDYNTEAITALERWFPEVVARLREKSFEDKLFAYLRRYEKAIKTYGDRWLRKYGFKE